MLAMRDGVGIRRPRPAGAVSRWVAVAGGPAAHGSARPLGDGMIGGGPAPDVRVVVGPRLRSEHSELAHARTWGEPVASATGLPGPSGPDLTVDDGVTGAAGLEGGTTCRRP